MKRTYNVKKSYLNPSKDEILINNLRYQIKAIIEKFTKDTGLSIKSIRLEDHRKVTNEHYFYVVGLGLLNPKKF